MKNYNFIVVLFALLFVASTLFGTAHATEINYKEALLYQQIELDCSKKETSYDFFNKERKAVIGEFSNVSASNDIHILIHGFEFNANQQLQDIVYVNQWIKPGQTVVKEWTLRKKNRVYMEIQSTDVEKLPPNTHGTQAFAWLYEKHQS